MNKKTRLYKINEMIPCDVNDVENQVEIKSIINSTIDSIETINAIETLEYHDKNYLSGDNESRCRNKIDEMNRILNRLRNATV